MSTVPKKLFCFQLVDINREPIQSGTIKLSSDSVVDAFRKAIKAEYADGFLKDVAAPDLEVFGNKASLQKPLDPFHSLGELGKREDPLIVVVPPPAWFQLVGADSLPFKGCSINPLRHSRSSSIRSLLDAVYTRNHNKLSYLDVEDLKVFENKAALETNNSLGVDDIIGNFDESKDDPLIVLVPSTSKLCLFFTFLLYIAITASRLMTSL
jgi:hypothetical protein